MKLKDDLCSSNDSVSACNLIVGGINADTDTDTDTDTFRPFNNKYLGNICSVSIDSVSFVVMMILPGTTVYDELISMIHLDVLLCHRSGRDL